MYFFKQCSVCGQSILAGWRQRGERRYCSRACADFSTHRGFCNTCLQQTEDESSGAMSINQIGTSFVGSWNRCATCVPDVNYSYPLATITLPHRLTC